MSDRARRDWGLIGPCKCRGRNLEQPQEFFDCKPRAENEKWPQNKIQKRDARSESFWRSISVWPWLFCNRCVRRFQRLDRQRPRQPFRQLRLRYQPVCAVPVRQMETRSGEHLRWAADPVSCRHPLRCMASLHRRVRSARDDHDRHGPDRRGDQRGLRLVARPTPRTGRQHPRGEHLQLERLRREPRDRRGSTCRFLRK